MYRNYLIIRRGKGDLVVKACECFVSPRTILINERYFYINKKSVVFFVFYLFCSILLVILYKTLHYITYITLLTVYSFTLSSLSPLQ